MTDHPRRNGWLHGPDAAPIRWAREQVSDRDAGPADAGPPDAGPLDAGPPDAGPPDAGPADGADADDPARAAGTASADQPPGVASGPDSTRGTTARPIRWGPADLRQWGIRPRLIVVLLIPTLAALFLGGLRMQSALSAGTSYARVESLASAAHQSTVLVHRLQAERDLTAGFLAGGRRRSLAELGHRPADVDRAATDLRRSLGGVASSHDASLQAKIRTAVGGLDRIAGVRKSATSAPTQPAARRELVLRDYTSIIDSLLALNGEISAPGQDSDQAKQVFAFESLALAKESAARQRAVLYGALEADEFPATTYADLAAARAQQAAGVAGFLSHASASQRRLFQSRVRGPDVDNAEKVAEAALDRRAADAWSVGASHWFALMSRQIELIRQVESSQVDDIVTRARDLRATARNGALTSALIICLILAFALLAALVVSRSMLRPLQTLRSKALDVAHRRLPDTVRRLQDGDASDAALSMQPEQVDARDEIGQVARAFDAVHRQAVRLAGEQALMRNNVSGMFVNLSRRSQTLVERQLRLIDELEASEQDPDRLANLFKLDHLATRMRRNDENLLVLAGGQVGRRRREPVPLVDVVRAASAEVEQYARVQLDLSPRYELAGAAVNDAVHLIAELLENAMVFSAPETPVRVRGQGLGERGEVMIEVEDQGIGMTAEELEKANEKLATPPVFDLSMSRMMGLFVVARLAQRQGIQVRLRSSPSGGVTALVRLPSAIVPPPSFRAEPGVGPRSVPEPQAEPGVRSRSVPGPQAEPGVRPRPVPGPSPTPVVETSRPTAPRDDELDRPLTDMPSFVTSLPDTGETERLPIFDALRSAWFKRPPSADLTAEFTAGLAGDLTMTFTGDLTGDRNPAVGSGSWTEQPATSWNSPGDEGWRAVAAMSTQPVGGVTAAGLPVRVPGRNLVPGSAAPAPADRVPARRAPEAGLGLSSYQQGIGRARTADATSDRARIDPLGGQSEAEQSSEELS